MQRGQNSLHAFSFLSLIRGCLALVLLCSGIGSQAAADNNSQIQLREGMTAPNWMMSDIGGDMHALYNELEQGNSVVMVFWASWCKFCHDLLPEIQLFRQTLFDDSIKFFAMNIWEDGDPVAYFDSRGLKLPLILNADNIAKRYAVEGTPGVVFISPSKTIEYVRLPGETTSSVMKALQKLVLKKTP